jgi:rhodanese-related sulfurtransferase
MRCPCERCLSVPTVPPDGGSVSEVSVEDAWERLASDPASVLIDVRTRAEWAFVGLPDVSSLGKQPVLIEWQQFPTNLVDADFADRLTSMLAQAGVGKDQTLLFLCRSGGRSLMAARAMHSAGYTRCVNIAQGFEGGLDHERHRGQAEGWKARKLPWVQG